VNPNFCTCAPDWLPCTGRISDICEMHDLDYGTGGNEWDRIKADTRFAWRIYNRALDTGLDKIANLWLADLRIRAFSIFFSYVLRGFLVALIYWLCVRFGGWTRYKFLWKSQFRYIK
jgi:hypothetical protein